ncbi:BTB/POZ domain-containing protein KCTD19 isoform X5 [Ascaphus truei]|uniref:BTB/POZ domain-containing protein KCTD19 isoform X4 n=1 Tax=Ascaphus truei TaxID=8439 RepID=UPI003F59434D
MEDADYAVEFIDADLFHFNVGGWLFSVPKVKLAQFQESLLWQEASALPESDNAKLFFDRDGFIFRHVHYFLHTSKLSFSSWSDLELLYEQALGLQLKPLIQALDNLREGKHHLRARPAAEIPVTERASINYWKTRKCNSRLSEFTMKSPVFTGLQDKTPLGLIDTPLLDSEEEVHYCFLPVDFLEKYPTLVTEDNLLWISENVALLECRSSDFRFIANFLHSGKMLLPDSFSDFEVLEAEVELLGIPELSDAVRTRQRNLESHSKDNTETLTLPCSMDTLTDNNLVSPKGLKPFYTMSLGLLVKYPDSALGQLHLESSVDGNKLYITGNGTLFHHVKNWLGSYRLPLTDNLFEIYGLCTYLDKGDIIYQPMKDALRTYLKTRTCTRIEKISERWKADVRVYAMHHIVKVYVGNHWYATYLKTLLKYPELLLNRRKVNWITCGFSLLVRGDGQMFRHILNFLRLGNLFLPSEFKEWSLFCQEVKEFKIPSIVEALYQCDAYRSWINENETVFKMPSPSDDSDATKQYSEQETHLSLQKVNGSPWDDSCKGKEAQEIQDSDRETEKYSPFMLTTGSKRVSYMKSEGQSPTQDFALDSSYLDDLVGPPSKKVIKKNQARKDEDRETVDTPMLKLISLVKQFNEINGKKTACDKHDKIHVSKMQKIFPAIGEKTLEYGSKWQPSGSEDREISSGYNKKADNLKKCWKPEMEEKDRTFFTETIRIDLSDLVANEVGNLGAILWIEHNSLVANDGSAASFEDSIVYTTELDSLRSANSGADEVSKVPDVAFLSFNMSYDEIFYARKCHYFLTGIILDSIRHQDPKSSTSSIIHLVNRLWAFQIPLKQFVYDLLSMEFYKDDKCINDTLLPWVELTLPYARRYSQCINIVLQRGLHKSASCCIPRKVLW